MTEVTAFPPPKDKYNKEDWIRTTGYKDISDIVSIQRKRVPDIIKGLPVYSIVKLKLAKTTDYPIEQHDFYYGVVTIDEATEVKCINYFSPKTNVFGVINSLVETKYYKSLVLHKDSLLNKYKTFLEPDEIRFFVNRSLQYATLNREGSIQTIKPAPPIDIKNYGIF